MFVCLFLFYRNDICPFFGTRKIKIYPDNFANREVEVLEVQCKNKEHGCLWRGRVKDIPVNILLQIDSLSPLQLVF